MVRQTRCVLVLISLIITSTTVSVIATSAAPERITVPQLQPLWTTGIISDGVGPAGLVVTDLTGDRTTDIAACGAGAPYVLNYVAPDQYDTVWYGEWLRCQKLAVADRNSDGIQELFVATQYTHAIHVFDGKTFRELDVLSLDSQQPIKDLLVANVDADADVELVITRADTTLVYDAETFALEWDANGYGGSELEVGNIDGDERVELIVNGFEPYRDAAGTTPARVLDVQTQTEKWSYAGSFGRSVAVGNLDGDHYAEIAYTSRPGSDDSLVVFDADTRSIKWQHGPTFNTAEIVALGDPDQNGLTDVLTGSGQWGTVRGYDGASGVKLWTIANPDFGVFGLATGDTDHDGHQDIVWATGIGASSRSSLVVGNWQTGAVTWNSDDLDAPLMVEADDVDADGRTEIIMASASLDSPLRSNEFPGSTGGMLRVYDAATQRIEWSTILNILPPDTVFTTPLAVYQVAVGQLDSDPAQEIVVGANDHSNVRLLVFDGKTRAREWLSEQLGPIDMITPAYQMEVVNLDGDAQDEIVLGLATGEVRVLDGQSKAVQWQSPVLDSTIQDVSIGQVDDDPALEMAVATIYEAYLFDLVSGQQQWRTDLSINNRPASPHVTIVDRTGERPGELVLTTTPYLQDQTLQVWSGTPMTRRWSKVLGTTVVIDIRSDDVTDDGVEELILMGHYRSTLTESSPSLLHIASPEGDGYTVTYTHPGRWGSVREVALANMDDDAQRELVFSTETMIQVNDVGQTATTSTYRLFLPHLDAHK